MPIVNIVRGRDVVITHPDLVNLYGCSIGEGSLIGPFVEIQKNSFVGARCKISSHSFICEGVTLQEGVFVGHGVMFTNDLFPHSTKPGSSLQRDGDWKLTTTLIRRNASIGSNATIIAGVVVGEGALVGAGAVVSKDVPDHAIVVGNPARVIGDVKEREHRSIVEQNCSATSQELAQ